MSGHRLVPHTRPKVRRGVKGTTLLFILVGLVGLGSSPATASSGEERLPAGPLTVVPGLLPGQAAPTTRANSSSASTSSGKAMVGIFKVAAGRCGSGGVTSGSSFAMIAKDGSSYVANSDSPCGDKNVTPMSPGHDGGLMTTRYQPKGSDGITAAVQFFGTPFRLSTNSTDPQTAKRVSLPTIRSSGGHLSGQTTAVSANWNGSDFNQGAPKPDGSSPGLTRALTGTYDAATGKYSLDWRSAIVGGSFDGFTGSWHLEGTFVPKTTASTTASTPAAPSSARPPTRRSQAAAEVPLTGFPVSVALPYALALIALGVNLLLQASVPVLARPVHRT